MGRLLLGVVFSVVFYVNAHACRFTVREIGFSTLSQDIYSLVVIDQNADASDALYQRMQTGLENSNFKLILLHPKTDATHPFVRAAINQKISLPANLIFAPDGRVFELKLQDVSDLAEFAVNSPTRSELIDNFVDVFSVVLWVEGKNKSDNSEFVEMIKNDCDRIENMMPHMPKEVRNGPKAIRISAHEFEQEKLVLWSLGIEELPKEPVAFVLYGRGRIMGGGLNAAEIADGSLYSYMSMIGADCECGLDRRWMLGNQIPMLWATESRQQLTNEVGFDVDNPMILAEMSRILAKETNPDIAGDIGFGIEVIDLNEAFGETPEINFNENDSEVKRNPLWIVILGFSVLVILTGMYLFYRNRNS